MGDWIRLWDRAVLIEFNLDHVRVVRPQEDGSVLLMLGGLPENVHARLCKHRCLAGGRRPGRGG